MLEQFFFLFGFFCSVFVICGVLMSPFFFGVGKEGAHFKRTRCTLFKLFSTRPHSFFSFFIINHLTKRSEKNTPRRTRERGDEDLKEPRKSIKLTQLLQKVIKVHTYLL